MNALVTGGGGFLGRYVVEALLARGHAVTVFSRGSYPELEPLGARLVRGDLGELQDGGALRRAAEGCDTLFHVAAKTGVWGPYGDYERANVAGTRNVLAVCRELGIPRLVHTSSPSVVFDGRDQVRAQNDLPYPSRHLCAYAATKAQAEREVLAANGPSLSTCALRPHLVFGPRDPHLVPRLLERARSGRLAIVGSGRNEVSLCYAENAADAHLLAAESLRPDAPHAGRAYFIAQDEPVGLWPWIGELLGRSGLPPVKRRVPLALAFAAGTLCEIAWRARRRLDEPPMTRFVALALARSHSYDMEPARRDFGYRPRVGMDEALVRTLRFLGASQERPPGARDPG